jgi:hypothetical protein
LQAVVGFGLAIPSVAGSHLLLNLREAYYHPTGETTFGRTYDLPTFGNKSANLTGVIGARRTKPGFELDTNWAMDPSLVSQTLPLYCLQPLLYTAKTNNFPGPKRNRDVQHETRRT